MYVFVYACYDYMHCTYMCPCIHLCLAVCMCGPVCMCVHLCGSHLGSYT